MYRSDSEFVKTKIKEFITWHVSIKDLKKYVYDFKNPKQNIYSSSHIFWEKFLCENLEDKDVSDFLKELKINNKNGVSYTNTENRQFLIHLLSINTKQVLKT